MNAALDLLREFEGFRETPYWDVNAWRTGYGSDTITTADGRVVPVGQGARVSREDAERDLLRRVDTEFGPRARQAVGAGWERLSPNQQAALVSITYNYGSLPGSVARAAASGDPAIVTAAIRALGSHNDGINRDRRNREADIFAAGGGQVEAPTGTNLTASAPPQNALASFAFPDPPQLRSNALDPAAFMTAPNALTNPLRHFPRFGNA